MEIDNVRAAAHAKRRTHTARKCTHKTHKNTPSNPYARSPCVVGMYKYVILLEDVVVGRKNEGE